MDIKDLIKNSIGEMDLDSIIKKEIKETVESTIKSKVNEHFRSYSNFGKKLEEEMNVLFDFDIKKLDLKSYNCLITETIKDSIQRTVKEKGVEDIKKKIENILSVETKEEYKLSEIIEELKKSIYNEFDWQEDYDSEISLIIGDTSYGSRWVYIGKKEELEKYECEYSFLLPEDGIISCLSFKELSKKQLEKGFFMNDLSRFEEFMFRLQTNKVKIINDENNCNLYLERDEEY